MNTSKIIKGVVGGGRYTVTAPIIKEDYGLYLKIEGLELPETYQVDFSNSEHNGTSVTMIGNSDGVLIPSQFISSGKDIFAFLYHVGADYGRTVFKFRIPNKCRPDRTDEQPTPEQQSVIDQAINALNSAVEQTAQDVIDADASAQASAESAQASGESALSASNSALSSSEYASNALGYAESASAFATASAQSAQSASQSAQTASAKADSIKNLTASAQTLPAGSSASASYDAQTGVMSFGIPRGADGTNGKDGKDGVDGEDGISPTVSVSPVTGGHEVTITDKDGDHSFDVMDGTDGGGMVVTATLVSGTQYTIDSTYDAIKTALSAGKTVVVMTGGVPQPYVGNVQLDGEWYLAFGVSTIFDNTATLTGFMIPQTYQNVAIWTAQNTVIPQLTDVQINGSSIVQDGVANVPIATTTRAGAMSAQDKGRLDSVYADYSSALTALGVI